MKAVWLIIFGLSFTVTSCIPLKQEDLIGDSAHRLAMAEDGEQMFAQIDLIQDKVIPELSYVEDPKGRRYGIRIEPHQFDIQQHYTPIRTDVFLLNTNGVGVQRWSRGIWHFHFVIDTNGTPQAIDQHWKYWMFYYNPIIHGPPN